MSEDAIVRILQALARVEEQVKTLRAEDSSLSVKVEKLSTRTDKLERIAYVALGIAMSTGLPDLVGLIK